MKGWRGAQAKGDVLKFAPGKMYLPVAMYRILWLSYS